MDGIVFHHKKRATGILACIVLTVSACGGGGGGTVESTGTPTSPAPPAVAPQFNGPPYTNFQSQDPDEDNFDIAVSEFETAEYFGMTGLAMINASSAYARGADGAGVTVGVVDSGVYEEHIEFESGAGNKVSIVGSDYASDNERSNDAIAHGTLIAGVIAANRDNSNNVNVNMHGVAYNADISTWEIPLGSGDDPYQPLEESYVTVDQDMFFAQRFDAMAGLADIINLSFGFSGVVTSFSSESIENALSNTLESLRQTNKSAGDRSIFVVAAGNAFDNLTESGDLADADSPELMPGLPYLFPELQNHMLAVVAVDNSGEIASYSNRCGVAASFCLAAPGGGDADGDDQISDNERILSPISPPESAQEGEYYYGGAVGTSLAAPLVSGSLALLKQLFPTVGHDELVNRLLITANKTGIYANEAIYGQGLLDLDSATRPVGATASATGMNLDKGTVSQAQFSITTLGGAVSEGLAASLGQFTIAVFDELGFPFYTNAASLVHSVSNSTIPTSLNHRTERLANGSTLQLGVAPNPWHKHYRALGNPNDQVQADYVALHFQDEGGAERFAGFNANPGWFFGVYADSGLTPAATKDDSSFAAPWLRYARQGWSSGGALNLGTGNNKVRVALFDGRASWNQWQTSSDQQSNGAIVEYSVFSGDDGLSIQTGFVEEQDSFLGTRIGPALGSAERGDTIFAGINGHLAFNHRWQGMLAAYLGKTETAFTSQHISIDDSITSSAWALGLKGRSLLYPGDQLDVYFSQPLRVEAGYGQLRVATGRTIDRQIIYSDLPFNLEPQGREQKLELNYRRPWQLLKKMAWVSGAAEYIHQPNHSALRQSHIELRLILSIPID
ncbi:MAG: S8 family peptidase [Porticoccaceae bacterium]